jgi:lactose/L-arabinose transport system permease protein
MTASVPAPALRARRARRPGASPVLSAILTTVLAIGAIVVIAPFIWLIVASTHSTPEIFSSPPAILPGGKLWANLAHLVTSLQFGDAIRNSVIVSVLYTLFGMLICSAAGYAFAKFSFRGRNAMFVVIVASLALPGQVTLVPLFKMMVALHWLNSYEALILPNLAMPFGIFLMRQAMQSVPDELIQAARIDGAGELRIFAQIVLPTMRPALAALAIFMFLGAWNDFAYPLIVLQTPDSYTIPVALATLHGVQSTDYGQLLSGTMLSIIPVLILFLALQRHFVAGLLAGSVKQ